MEVMIGVCYSSLSDQSCQKWTIIHFHFVKTKEIKLVLGIFQYITHAQLYSHPLVQVPVPDIHVDTMSETKF